MSGSSNSGVLDRNSNPTGLDLAPSVGDGHLHEDVEVVVHDGQVVLVGDEAILRGHTAH